MYQETLFGPKVLNWDKKSPTLVEKAKFQPKGPT
jgi:hypothetical protein